MKALDKQDANNRNNGDVDIAYTPNSTSYDVLLLQSQSS